MTSFQNLFVAKIPHDATDNDLMRIFGRFNPVSAKVMLDAASGTSKGFGFVLFTTEEEGAIAHKALDRSTAEVNGRTFTVNACPSKYDARVAAHHSPSLYIRNIPRSFPQSEVDALLNSFGRVVSSILRDEPNGYPVWVIYVRYEKQQDADAALNALHNNHQLFPNSEVPVLAKYAKQKTAGSAANNNHNNINNNNNNNNGPVSHISNNNSNGGALHSLMGNHNNNNNNSALTLQQPCFGNSPHDGAWPTPPGSSLQGHPMMESLNDFGSCSHNSNVHPNNNNNNNNNQGNPQQRRRSGGSPQHLTLSSPNFVNNTNHNRRFSSGSTPSCVFPQQNYFAAPNDVRRFSTSSFHQYHPAPLVEDDTLNVTQQPRKSSMDLDVLQQVTSCNGPSGTIGGGQLAPGTLLSVGSQQRSPTVSPTNKQIDANGYYRHSPYGFA